MSSFGLLEEIRRPSERTLAVGQERSLPFKVTGPLLTDVGGTIATSVLSTPGMIAMMERTCTVLALEGLPAELATVGFHVDVKHVAGALQDTECEVHVRLCEVLEERKLRFDVRVSEPISGGEERMIGFGTHERRIINVASHAASTGQPKQTAAGG